LTCFEDTAKLTRVQLGEVGGVFLFGGSEIQEGPPLENALRCLKGKVQQEYIKEVIKEWAATARSEPRLELLAVLSYELSKAPAVLSSKTRFSEPCGPNPGGRYHSSKKARMSAGLPISAGVIWKGGSLNGVPG
jgi:hypothetical protein